MRCPLAILTSVLIDIFDDRTKLSGHHKLLPHPTYPISLSGSLSALQLGRPQAFALLGLYVFCTILQVRRQSHRGLYQSEPVDRYHVSSGHAAATQD